MKYDSYKLDGDVNVFPLIILDRDEKRYVVYKKDNFNLNYVGEIKDNKIIPVDDNLIIEFDKIFKDTLDIISRKEVE